MPPKNLKQEVDAGDEDYDPDTDTPDTTESDQMLNDALGGEGGSGIGKISTLHNAQKGAEMYSDYTTKQAKARADAAKSMERKPEEE